MSVQTVTPLHDTSAETSWTSNSGEHQSSDRPLLRALPKVRRRQRGVIALAVGILAVALAAVLGMNISMASSQYLVVQMQNEHRQLTYENQTLAQQVQFRQSPQELSTAAVGLGMVTPTVPGTFDLNTSSILSEASPAGNSDRPSNFVASPSVSGHGGAPAVDVSEFAQAPSGLLGSGALDTLTHAPGGENEGGPAGPAEDSGSHHGPGSIPGPALEQ